MAHLLRLAIINRYDPAGWNCTDLPAAPGETPVGGVFLKQRCEKVTPERSLMVEAAYGAIWSRPGLALADRMICALAALTAVQRLPQLARHVGAALELGLQPRAIREVLIQIGIYAGFAASEESVEIAAAEFAARQIAMPEEPERTDSLETLTERGRKLMERLHGDRARHGYAAPGNTVTSPSGENACSA